MWKESEYNWAYPVIHIRFLQFTCSSIGSVVIEPCVLLHRIFLWFQTEAVWKNVRQWDRVIFSNQRWLGYTIYGHLWTNWFEHAVDPIQWNNAGIRSSSLRALEYNAGISHLNKLYFANNWWALCVCVFISYCFGIVRKCFFFTGSAHPNSVIKWSTMAATIKTNPSQPTENHGSNENAEQKRCPRRAGCNW